MSRAPRAGIASFLLGDTAVTPTPRPTALPLVLLALAGTAGSAPAQQAATEYRVDPARSHIVVVTGRSGLLSFLGHEHAILATSWDATLCYDEAAPESSRAALVVDTRALVIDTDSARALAGLGDGPGEGTRAELQEKLLAPERLAAAEHPRLSFRTTTVRPEDAHRLVVRGALEIRGTSREVELPVEVERPAPDELRLTGRLRFKQSDYGIRPETVAGVVKVKDEVDLRVTLVGVRTAGACPLPAPGGG